VVLAQQAVSSLANKLVSIIQVVLALLGDLVALLSLDRFFITLQIHTCATICVGPVFRLHRLSNEAIWITPTQVARWQKSAVNDSMRMCKACGADNEEEHLLMHCQAYARVRQK